MKSMWAGASVGIAVGLCRRGDGIAITTELRGTEYWLGRAKQQDKTEFEDSGRGMTCTPMIVETRS